MREVAHQFQLDRVPVKLKKKEHRNVALHHGLYTSLKCNSSRSYCNDKDKTIPFI